MRLRQVGRFEAAAGAGIQGSLRPVRRGEAGGDVGARAETGIEQVLAAQPVERRVVQVEALRLEGDRTVPFEAQPFEIAQDRRDMLGPRAGAVDILDAEREAAAMRSGKVVRLDRRPGMAKMQAAGGAGRKSGVDNHQFGP